MKTKHTPGPWRLEEVEDRSIKHLCPVDQDDNSLLTVVYQDETPFAAVYTDADARLIAAAPELLEALNAEQEWRARDEAGAIDPEWDYEVMVGNKRRAAIAKATGSAA